MTRTEDEADQKTMEDVSARRLSAEVEAVQDKTVGLGRRCVADRMPGVDVPRQADAFLSGRVQMAGMTFPPQTEM